MDPLTSALLTVGTGHTDSVNTLALSDNLLASGSEDKSLCLWSVTESQRPVSRAYTRFPCCDIKFSKRCPNTLYAACNDFIYILDIRNLQTPINEWNVNKEEINSIDLLEEESRLASADDSGSIEIVDINTGESVRTLKKHDNICSCVRFRPNHQWQLISGGLDCRLMVTDWKGSGLGVTIFEMNEILENSHESSSSSQYSHEFDQDSVESDGDFTEYDYVILNDQNAGHANDTDHPVVESNTVTSSDFGSGSQSDHFSANDDESIDSNFAPHEVNHELSRTNTSETANGCRFLILPMLHIISCSKTGDYVAVGLESNTVELFAGGGKRLSHLESLNGHTQGVTALHFFEHQHNTILVSGGNDRNMFVWTMGQVPTGLRMFNGEKLHAIEGTQLTRVFVADVSPEIRVLDLSIV